jgi:hypothetical protein
VLASSLKRNLAFAEGKTNTAKPQCTCIKPENPINHFAEGETITIQLATYA